MSATYQARAFREYNPVRKTAAEIQGEIELMRRLASRPNRRPNRRRSQTPITDELALYCFAAVAMAIPALAAVMVFLL
jgi:hypothetical protein